MKPYGGWVYVEAKNPGFPPGWRRAERTLFLDHLPRFSAGSLVLDWGPDTWPDAPVDAASVAMP